MYEREGIEFEHIDGTWNPSNLLTKPLGPLDLGRERKFVGVFAATDDLLSEFKNVYRPGHFPYTTLPSANTNSSDGPAITPVAHVSHINMQRDTIWMLF